MASSHSTINVLVTAVGTGIGQSVIKGLRLSDRDYRIVGIDISPWAAGLYRCDRGYLVPKANDIDYYQRLKEIIRKEDIDILIPACDPEVKVLSLLKPIIERECEVPVLVAPHDAVMIGRNKHSTSKFLKENGFAYPKTVNLNDAKELIDEVGFPIIVKPKQGSGTSRVQVIFDERELDLYRIRTGDTPFAYVAQEYLIPKNWNKSRVTRKDVYKHGLLNQIHEYSTEILVSKQGQIIGAITNWRTMKKGYPIRAIVDSYPEVTERAREVVQRLIDIFDYVGPCNLQCRVTDKGPTFFEINPRFSGSTAVRCKAGFNGPDVLVQNFVNNISEGWAKQLRFKKIVEIRYWNEMYVDAEKFEGLEKTRTVDFSGHIPDYF